ncbi:Serine/threonine-protein kinase dclk3 [Physocladia obscura]|uniref:Serine/threonine-protein kinase dclk3 n=1 Tax=Physocladia obscura TaxID=109957 RepID=A0AAD5T635_9FUNG|nr:Serine/threonine-protein kinase dclk3 [Physocladia obscura]
MNQNSLYPKLDSRASLSTLSSDSLVSTTLLRPFKGHGGFALRVKPATAAGPAASSGGGDVGALESNNNAGSSENNTIESESSDATASKRKSAASADHNNPHLAHDPRQHDVVLCEPRPHKSLYALMRKMHLVQPDGASDVVLSDSPVKDLPPAEPKSASTKRQKVLDLFLKLKTDVLKISRKSQDELSKKSTTSAKSDSPPPKYSLSRRQSGNNANFDYNDPEFKKPALFRRLSVGFGSSEIQDEVALKAEEESYERLKEYKFIKILVTLRLHLPTNSIRALKSIPTAPSAVDNHVRDSFHREVEILQACRNHPSIIRLLDSWESINTVYQVFDVMNGGDASMEGVFTNVGESMAVRLIAPIADALRFLHKKQILHRDVRPANIFLRRSITGHETLRELETIPVLADFGIANYMRNSGRLAAPFPETPAHIAPEIIDGARFTTASDCYGLGYYAMHLILHRQPLLNDVRSLDDILDHTWSKVSETGKTTVGMLLCGDPTLRMTAGEFCDGEWTSAFGVECVKHHLF